MTIEVVEWCDVPLCKCGRYMRIETVKGRWLCGVCDRDEAVKCHRNLQRVLEIRDRILARK